MAQLTKMEKEKMAQENMSLVHYVAKKFQNSGIDYNELFSIGILGYAKALNKYDTERDVKFSTYAYNCIMNEIKFFLRKEKRHMNTNISLNACLSVDKNGNNLELEDILSEGDLHQRSLEDLIIEGDDKIMLMKGLKYLNDKEKYIMVYRYGLDRGIIKTQKEIADKIGMSQANVSKMQKNCLDKIKELIDTKTI